MGFGSLDGAIYSVKGPTRQEEATRDPEATGSPTPSPEDRGQLSHPSTSCAKDQGLEPAVASKMSSFALPRRATLMKRPLVAALAAAVLCLALVAVAATRDEASVAKRPALARQQPSPFGDVSRTIWASDKYRGDLGRSLFLTVFGPGVIIAVLIGARCRDPPRRRRKNVPVAHARYDGEAEAVVADASDDDELDLLPAARPVHRNPFGSPGRPQSREV